MSDPPPPHDVVTAGEDCEFCGRPVRLELGAGALGWVHVVKHRPDPAASVTAAQQLRYKICQGKALAWQRGFDIGLNAASRRLPAPPLNPYGTVDQGG